MTGEELLKMPGSQRCELVKGELRMMAPAGFDHGAVISHLNNRLLRFVYDNGLGELLGAETGFRLSRKPDTVRAPDASFVRKDRIPAAGRPKGYFEGAPDLAVEVLSPGDTAEEIEEKVDDYLAAGSPLVWVVNPRRRTVTVHRLDANPVVLRIEDTLDGADVLPGFTMKLSEVFA